MQYFIIHDNQIIIANNQMAFINNDYTEEVHELPEDYNSEKYIVVDGELVLNPNYEDEQTAKRKADFENQFIETSMKDSNNENGYYRQVPHGYANAPQTIELVDKYVRDFEGMTEQIAQMLIFYQKPDFTKAEQCTEEWLIAHQFNPPADMTLQEWKAFEFDFEQRWANLKYKQQQAQQQIIV